MGRIRNEFKAGIFVIVSLVFFGLSIFTMGRERQLFERQSEYWTTFKDVKGLAEGASVRLGGISIGRVSSIDFSREDDTAIKVSLLVNDKYTSRIHKDSVITIETQGLLGDKFLNITTGFSKVATLPGEQILSRQSGDINEMVDQVRTIVERTDSITKTVDDVVKKVAEGPGFTHELIYSKELGENMSSVGRELAGMLKQIREGDGVLHSLVYTKDGKDSLKSLGRALADIEKTSQTINDIASAIKNGNGTLHELVYGKGPGDLKELVKTLNETSLSLKRASEALANGTGTLGALLIDPSLYDNLVEITDGAKRSFLLRQAIKQSLKK